MTAFSPPANACEPCNYLYTFVYDDGQLVPDVTFAASNISGVLCEGCLTQWVQDTVGNDVKLERRDIEGVTYLVLTNQHGCEFAFLEGELPS